MSSTVPTDSIAISFGTSFKDNTAISGKLNVNRFFKEGLIFGDTSRTCGLPSASRLLWIFFMLSNNFVTLFP